jgi:hypothetical protein
MAELHAWRKVIREQALLILQFRILQMQL